MLSSRLAARGARSERIFDRHLQPTIACAFSKRAPTSRSAIRSRGADERHQLHAGTSASVDLVRLSSLRPGGERAKEHFLLHCSDLIEPLTLRRSTVLDLTFRVRSASAPPRSLPPSRRETVWAFPIQSAFHRPGDPGRPESFAELRSGFSPDPPPRTTLLRSPRLARVKPELVEERYPPGFLLVRVVPEAERRPSMSAAQSTRGHSPQATSPLCFAKSERENESHAGRSRWDTGASAVETVESAPHPIQPPSAVCHGAARTVSGGNRRLSVPSRRRLACPSATKEHARTKPSTFSSRAGRSSSDPPGTRRRARALSTRRRLFHPRPQPR